MILEKDSPYFILFFSRNSISTKVVVGEEGRPLILLSIFALCIYFQSRIFSIAIGLYVPYHPHPIATDLLGWNGVMRAATVRRF